MYDIDLIVEEASPIGIVKYLGIPTKESGKTIFIECPVHERETGSRDRHINNCVLGKTFKNAFYCHSCHGFGNGFDLISGFLNLDIKKDFIQILKIAAESCGGEELFVISDSEYSKRKRKKGTQEEFGIFVDELKELGLEPNLFSNIYLASYDESQLSDIYGLKRDTNFDVYTENQLNKVSYLEIQTQGKLFSSLPRNIYFDIVKSKAKEKMEFYKRLVTDRKLFEHPLMSYVNPDQRESLAEELKNEFRLRYISVENIYCKVASKDEISQINDNWLYDI